MFVQIKQHEYIPIEDSRNSKMKTLNLSMINNTN